jgi:hypothetical protein
MWKKFAPIAVALSLSACAEDASAPTAIAAKPMVATAAANTLPTPIAGSGITVAGMSNYCSRLAAGGGGHWTFNFGTADPCGSSFLFTTARAGMYSTYGLNKVLAWCDPNHIIAIDGYGRAPLDSAKAAATMAVGTNAGRCVFTVAPAEMRFFDWPYDPNGVYPPNYHGSGFDFERPPYNSGSSIVDFRGKNVSFINDHDGHDFGMPPGRPMRAVADGVVITAGYFRGTYTNCNYFPGLKYETGLPDCGHEAIIIVRHTVNASNPRYNETFATGYFHVQEIASNILAGCTPVDRSQLPMGTGGVCSVPVTKGQLLGYSGRRNTNAAHLHFATWRLSNTTRRDTYGYRAPDNVLHAPTCCNFWGSIGPSLITEPYGWRPSPTTDPWAYKARAASVPFPEGAGNLSIRLWKVDPPIHW